MKKTAYFIAIFALLATVLPVTTVQAQAYPYQSYGYADVFSFYQYPIQWYTYFETPNSSARNYVPSNYYMSQVQPYGSSYGSGCGYNTCGCGYRCGSQQGTGFTPAYNNQSYAPRYNSYSGYPSFYMTGGAPIVSPYIVDSSSFYGYRGW